MPEPTAPKVELPGGATNNRSQDAYEELRELLRQIEVFPSQMRVDWGTEEGEAPIVLGALRVVDVLRINRALREAARRTRPTNLLEERPHVPLVGETVRDRSTDQMGEVAGYLLRPLDGGVTWTADPNDIRRPDRDSLMRARMSQLDRDRRATPPPASLEPAEADRVAT
ncbi:hypothetical protein AB5J55_22285 [Streptomyces sp. R11]|uniref:Uncharacterized protein n=1 Tax=Streptomyces sp. R11 TaxID=3238625 RepID=A0AB39N2T4_9ACTN